MDKHEEEKLNMDQEIKQVVAPRIPHQAIVNINAVINQQLPDGSWQPRSTFHDQFYLRLTGNSEKEVKDSLVKKLDELKKQWGQVGRLALNPEQDGMSALLNAQTIESNPVISGSLDSEECGEKRDETNKSKY